MGRKEANNIEEQAFDVKKAQEFRNKEKEMQRILNLSVDEAKESGVPKTTLWDAEKDKGNRGFEFEHSGYGG